MLLFAICKVWPIFFPYGVRNVECLVHSLCLFTGGRVGINSILFPPTTKLDQGLKEMSLVDLQEKELGTDRAMLAV